MVEVVQYFNGKQQRVIGKARAFGGVVKLVKSVAGAGEGWGVKIHGSRKALRAIGAYPVGETIDGVEAPLDFQFTTKRGKTTQMHTFLCVEEDDDV
jgi:hypothetical protein